MKIKIAVEFETDIGNYSNQKLEVLRNKIINAVQKEHNNIIPTGDWMFVSEEDKEYVNGVLYD